MKTTRFSFFFFFFFFILFLRLSQNDADSIRVDLIRFRIEVSWWRLGAETVRFEGKMNGIGSRGLSNIEMEYIRRHHRHQPGENQCASALVKHIRAPVPQVTLLFTLLRLLECSVLLGIQLRLLECVFF